MIKSLNSKKPMGGRIKTNKLKLTVVIFYAHRGGTPLGMHEVGGGVDMRHDIQTLQEPFFIPMRNLLSFYAFTRGCDITSRNIKKTHLYVYSQSPSFVAFVGDVDCDITSDIKQNIRLYVYSQSAFLKR